jgi:hypothetical protein
MSNRSFNQEQQRVSVIVSMTAWQKQHCAERNNAQSQQPAGLRGGLQPISVAIKSLVPGSVERHASSCCCCWCATAAAAAAAADNHDDVVAICLVQMHYCAVLAVQLELQLKLRVKLQLKLHS